MFSILTIVLEFIAFVGIVLLGVSTLQTSPKSITNRLFFLFSSTLALYIWANYLSAIQSVDSLTLFWIRVVMGLALLINIFYFLLVFEFPNIKRSLAKNWYYLIGLCTLPLLFLSQTAAIFSSVNPGTNQPVPGKLIPLFLIHTLVFLVGGVIILFKKFKVAKGVIRIQLRYLIFATAFMFVSILLTNVFFVLVLKTTAFIGLLPIYTTIFVGLISYAILRHKFLDIRLIVARSIAYSVVVLILVLSYSSGIFLVGTYVIGYEIRPINMIVSVFFAFIIAISYHPLLRNIEHITDKLFFKDRYDSRFLLAKLGRIMASTLELKEIAQMILKTLLKDMRISKGYLLLMRENQIIWSYGQSYNHALAHNFVGDYISFLIESAHKKREDNILLFEELQDGAEKDIMREYGMSIAFPLLVEGKPIGLMWFGSKLSGETYSTEDMHLFKILAPEVAVAVKNSLQYDEIKQFNVTLQEKIKHATYNLRSANHKLKELDKMKDDFVSVASHELRTPMTAIKSYLWLALAGKGGKLSVKQEYYLQRSYNSVDRLIKLVNDMLNISRIESGRIFVSLAKTDILALINEVIEEIKPRIDELKLNIKVDFSKDGSLSKEDVKELIADPDKVKEVVLNLIGNSLKFTEEGGLISIFFTKEGNKIVTNVKDTGRGIDAKDMGTLFTKFGMVQGSYATNKKASGTGLGLYISKSIIELHDGEMKASSEGIGKGATFSFSLPIYSPKLFKDMNDELNTGKRDQTIGIIHTTL